MLAYQGTRWVLCDVNQEAIEKLGKQLGTEYPGNIIVQAVDMTDRPTVPAFFTRANEHFG